MLINHMGANEISFEELEKLFEDDTQPTTPAVNEDTTDTQGGNNETSTGTQSNNVETTKAFATRLKESTEKARREEREAIAKSLGYESYDAMEKARNDKFIQDRGLNPEEVAPIVEELVAKRFESDPRMQELENFKKQQLAEFAKKELEEIKELTDGEITSLSQLSKDVLNRWRETGSLTSAYLEKEGKNLIGRIKNTQSKGTTNHMQVPSGNTAGNSKQRPLNEQEKNMWRFFNPGISEEELNKKFVDK